MRKAGLIFLGIALIIHGYFYLSAFVTHTLDPWFENITPGQDFFQVPAAAYSFIRGGDLQGKLPPGTFPYTDCCGVNANVYHPLFTLLLGLPLQMLPDWTAFSLWTIIHAVITILTLALIFRAYRNHNYIFWTMGLYLMVNYHYYEIKMAQYHFLFVFFTFMFMLTIIRNRNESLGGFWLFLSLMVKPIGLLYILPLIIYRKFHTVAVALGLFALATVPTLFFENTSYYVNNIKGVIGSQVPTNYNLYSLAEFGILTTDKIKILSYIVAIGLVIYQIYKKPAFFTVITGWTCYQMMFYSLVFPYNYIIMATIIALSILENNLKMDIWSIIAISLFIIPGPAIIFHLNGSPQILPLREYLALALWSITTLIIYCSRLFIQTAPEINESRNAIDYAPPEVNA